MLENTNEIGEHQFRDDDIDHPNRFITISNIHLIKSAWHCYLKTKRRQYLQLINQNYPAIDISILINLHFMASNVSHHLDSRLILFSSVVLRWTISAAALCLPAADRGLSTAFAGRHATVCRTEGVLPLFADHQSSRFIYQKIQLDKGDRRPECGLRPAAGGAVCMM